MWVIVHSLSGLTLGAVVPFGTLLTIVCALFLHLGLDLVPHWDYTRDRRRSLWACLDVAVSIIWVLVFFFYLDLPGRALLAALVSAAPDVDVLDALLPGSRHRRWFPSHWGKFPHGTAAFARGILTQLLVILGSVLLLIVGVD